jgi:D-alanyl-D-alanine carboxypeptidase/D-alanyl-D-alanine-endopeptidase (penicillin-binding protein 4)
VLDRNGARWIVVMIVNHANANAAQPAIDALVEWVQQGARHEARGTR